MKIFKKNKILRIILFIIVFNLLLSNFVTFAKNVDSTKEVIFVVDTSNSMKSFDSENLVMDEIKKIANFSKLQVCPDMTSIIEEGRNLPEARILPNRTISNDYYSELRKKHLTVA